MARITIEDGLKKGYNKFVLVHLAAKRAVQLKKGKEPLVDCDNREIVAALREIEAGRVIMRPEGSPSEAYLESEPQLPAPTDERIEAETVAGTFEEVAIAPDVELVDQREQDFPEEDGAEMDEDQEEPDSSEEEGAEVDTGDQGDDDPEEE
jgi:DNA-directed RNA polymerase subunit omega